MASLIEHREVLDVRDLADLARECEDVLEDEDDFYDADEREDAQDTLDAFRDLLRDLGRSTEHVSDELASMADNDPTLIDKDYFVTYAEELADDIGAVDRDASWPLTHIDWDAAADDLKQDYSEAEFDGHTYYTRSW